jgi:hypothetical protein
MENSYKHSNNQPTLFSSMCDVVSGIFLPNIDPVEAKDVRVMCPTAPKDIISCKNLDKDIYLKEVDGLGFDTVKIQQPTIPFFPVIPIIDRGMFNLPGDQIESKVVGVSLEDIFSSAPTYKDGHQVLSPLVIRHNVLRSPVFKGKTPILFASGRDILIENLWQEFNVLDFAEAIHRMGFLAVTGINFSLFFGECPFSHALNLKKSLKSIQLFHGAGTTVIPHVYFLHELHLKLWLQWLKENPTVGTITINCQFRRKENGAFMEEGIIYLLENVGRKLTIILEGSNPRSMPKLFKKYRDSIVVAMKGMSLSASIAHSQYQIVGGKLKHINAWPTPVADILNSNVRTYAEYIKIF